MKQSQKSYESSKLSQSQACQELAARKLANIVAEALDPVPTPSRLVFKLGPRGLIDG